MTHLILLTTPTSTDYSDYYWLPHLLIQFSWRSNYSLFRLRVDHGRCARAVCATLARFPPAPLPPLSLTFRPFSSLFLSSFLRILFPLVFVCSGELDFSAFICVLGQNRYARSSGNYFSSYLMYWAPRKHIFHIRKNMFFDQHFGQQSNLFLSTFWFDKKTASR